MGQILDRAEFLAKSDLEKFEETVEKMELARVCLFATAAVFCLMGFIMLTVGWFFCNFDFSEINIGELFKGALDGIFSIMILGVMLAFTVTVIKLIIFPRY